MAGVDVSELEFLRSELESAGTRVGPAVERVTLVSANRVRDQAKSLVGGSIRRKYLKHYPSSITAEMVDSGGDSVAAEVGPETGRPQGGMGRGVEFGSVNHGPITHMFPALDLEEDPYTEAVGDAAVRSMFT